jgi:hypothetical protein
MLRYRFQCSEQLASRLTTVVLLKDFCEDRKESLAIQRFCLKSLVKRMDPKEGFSMYGSDHPSLFCSLHVILSFALVNPLLLGEVKVPKESYRACAMYLESFQTRIDTYQAYLEKSWHGYKLSNGTLRELWAQAFCCYATMFSECHAGAADWFDENKAELSLCGKAYMIQALVMDRAANGKRLEELKQELTQCIVDEGDTAHVITALSFTRDENFELLHSNVQSDAVALYALILCDPQNPVVPKLCKGLLSRQVSGRFGNTLENFWAVLALRRYFHIYEGEVPDFETRIWVGKASNAQSFKGRSNKTYTSTAKITEAGDLLLLKAGPGRLYYDLQLQLISAEPNLKSKIYGFGIVVRLNGSEATEHEFCLGQLVEVEVQVHVPLIRHHVAITSPFAGGMELSSSLRNAWWCDHENKRDDRVEWFSKEMRPGLYVAKYHVRTTTSGSFVMCRARAECMYREDLYGSTPDIRVTIRDEKAETGPKVVKMGEKCNVKNVDELETLLERLN